jgi:hypothetical protein
MCVVCILSLATIKDSKGLTAKCIFEAINLVHIRFVGLRTTVCVLFNQLLVRTCILFAYYRLEFRKFKFIFLKLVLFVFVAEIGLGLEYGNVYFLF